MEDIIVSVIAAVSPFVDFNFASLLQLFSDLDSSDRYLKLRIADFLLHDTPLACHYLCLQFQKGSNQGFLLVDFLLARCNRY